MPTETLLKSVDAVTTTNWRLTSNKRLSTRSDRRLQSNDKL